MEAWASLQGDMPLEVGEDPDKMQSFPESFAAHIKCLAEEVRRWAACRAQDEGASWIELKKVDEQRQVLVEEGVLGEAACQQLHDMGIGAAGVAMFHILDREEFMDQEEAFVLSCDPVPDTVAEALWLTTQQLFLCGAALTCAEINEDAAEEEKQRRLYDRHARKIAGLGKAATRAVARDDPDGYAQRAAEVIPATVVMFSGCQDCQTSADVYNTSSFGLPDDAGPGGAGGACTSSMIKALSEGEDFTWVSLLHSMRDILDGQYTQIPMLSSSRAMDLNSPFSVQHPEPSGRCRALLVGINYPGSNAELRGCHNDVETMRIYLLDHGYTEDDMRILMDDGEHEDPTRANIVEGFKWLVEGASAGDSLFFHYSGHGASVKDQDDEEEDGKDEALVPCDYQSAGLLRDDETFEFLVAPLQEGAWLTCVLDCCHSGTILDLPYMFKADAQGLQAVEDGEVATMQPNGEFDFGKLVQVVKDHPGMCAGALAVTASVYFMAGPEKSKAVGKALMDVITSENKAEALLGAAGSIMGTLFAKPDDE